METTMNKAGAPSWIQTISLVTLIIAIGTAVAYGVKLVVAPLALPLALGCAATLTIAHMVRRHDPRDHMEGGGMFFITFVVFFLTACVGMLVITKNPGLAPRSPITADQLAEVSKSLEDSATPQIRARRNAILAEEARGGALDLRGYLTYSNRIATDTVDRQLGNAG